MKNREEVKIGRVWLKSAVCLMKNREKSKNWGMF